MPKQPFKVGEPVWALMEGYPWWPARVVTIKEVVLDPGHDGPDINKEEQLVEFFNDNKRFAAIERKKLRAFVNPRYDALNKNNRHYVEELELAVVEANDYAVSNGYKKSPEEKGKGRSKPQRRDTSKERQQQEKRARPVDNETDDNEPLSEEEPREKKKFTKKRRSKPMGDADGAEKLHKKKKTKLGNAKRPVSSSKPGRRAKHDSLPNEKRTERDDSPDEYSSPQERKRDASSSGRSKKLSSPDEDKAMEVKRMPSDDQEERHTSGSEKEDDVLGKVRRDPGDDQHGDIDDGERPETPMKDVPIKSDQNGHRAGDREYDRREDRGEEKRRSGSSREGDDYDSDGERNVVKKMSQRKGDRARKRKAMERGIKGERNNAREARTNMKNERTKGKPSDQKLAADKVLDSRKGRSQSHRRETKAEARDDALNIPIPKVAKKRNISSPTKDDNEDEDRRGRNTARTKDKRPSKKQRVEKRQPDGNSSLLSVGAEYASLTKEQAIAVILARDKALRESRKQLWQYRLNNKASLGEEHILVSKEKVRSAVDPAIDCLQRLLDRNLVEEGESEKSDVWKEFEKTAVDKVLALQNMHCDTSILRESKLVRKIMDVTNSMMFCSWNVTRVLRDLIVQWVDIMGIEEVSEGEPSSDAKQGDIDLLTEDQKANEVKVEWRPRAKTEKIPLVKTAISKPPQKKSLNSIPRRARPTESKMCRDQSPRPRTRRDEFPGAKMRQDESPAPKTRRDESPNAKARRAKSPVAKARRDGSPISKARRDKSPSAKVHQDESPGIKTSQDESTGVRTRGDESPDTKVPQIKSPGAKSLQAKSLDSKPTTTEEGGKTAVLVSTPASESAQVTKSPEAKNSTEKTQVEGSSVAKKNRAKAFTYELALKCIRAVVPPGPVDSKKVADGVNKEDVGTEEIVDEKLVKALENAVLPRQKEDYYEYYRAVLRLVSSMKKINRRQKEGIETEVGKMLEACCRGDYSDISAFVSRCVKSDLL